MRNRAIFKQIKEYVEAQGFTTQQVEDSTAAQLASLTGIDINVITPHFGGIKKLILEDMQEAEDLLLLKSIRDQVKDWLDANYPGWKYDVQKSLDGKLGVTIWPLGKPEQT